eukprot:jgi/Hompol1/5478/HPOL_000917-RA
MLGMLVTGFLLRNLLPGIIVPIPHAWTTRLWSIALTSVVARAGLSIDKQTILANIHVTTAVGTVPVLFEALCLASMSAMIFAVPPAWAMTLGFGVASISPGVVVPLLLNLTAERSELKSSRLPPLILAHQKSGMRK